MRRLFIQRIINNLEIHLIIIEIYKFTFYEAVTLKLSMIVADFFFILISYKFFRCGV